jgi:hypothetical protein
LLYCSVHKFDLRLLLNGEKKNDRDSWFWQGLCVFIHRRREC